MFSYQRLKRTLLASCAACLLTGQALADDAVIDNSFHPYQAKLPSYPGLTSGMVINKENVAQFKDIIDPAFLRFIEEGWTTITVGDTTSFDLHSSYIDATRNSLGKVSLGEKVGEISGWHAGRPFPQEPSADAPRATVSTPMATTSTPASCCIRRRLVGRRRPPRTPVSASAGTVPSPNTAIVSAPEAAPPVVAATASMP